MRLELRRSAVFQEKSIPPGTRLAGWSALVDGLGIAAPVRHPSSVSARYVSGSRRNDGEWIVFDKRYWPGELFADHLTFALRHEDIDLLILKRVFAAVPITEFEALIRSEPTAMPVRRAWYLYELLTGQTLDVEDAPRAVADVKPSSFRSMTALNCRRLHRFQPSRTRTSRNDQKQPANYPRQARNSSRPASDYNHPEMDSHHD